MVSKLQKTLNLFEWFRGNIDITITITGNLLRSIQTTPQELLPDTIIISVTFEKFYIKFRMVAIQMPFSTTTPTGQANHFEQT